MKLCTFLAALLALCNWTFVVSGKAMAHGGTDFAVLDCEDENGDKTERTFDCEEEDHGDSQRAVLDCEDEGGDKDGAVLDCHDNDDDGGDQS